MDLLPIAVQASGLGQPISYACQILMPYNKQNGIQHMFSENDKRNGRRPIPEKTHIELLFSFLR